MFSTAQSPHKLTAANMHAAETAPEGCCSPGFCDQEAVPDLTYVLGAAAENIPGTERPTSEGKRSSLLFTITLRLRAGTKLGR